VRWVRQSTTSTAYERLPKWSVELIWLILALPSVYPNSSRRIVSWASTVSCSLLSDSLPHAQSFFVNVRRFFVHFYACHFSFQVYFPRRNCPPSICWRHSFNHNSLFSIGTETRAGFNMLANSYFPCLDALFVRDQPFFIYLRVWWACSFISYRDGSWW